MRELLDRIREAHVAIRPQVPVTPLERSHALSTEFGADVWLKCEHHQPTGSFKLRGATNKMRLLAEAGETRGIITASTGNHGQAAARSGRLAGIPVRVYVAASTVPSKLEAIRALGAELVLVEGPPILAETSAREAAAAEGLVYVSPYNDLDVVAGQGTLGMELFDQAPDLDAVFIAVGGGGLIGGTGTALKALRPELRVVGCWPENSACMLRAIEAGGIVDVAEGPTLSDGTAGAIEAGSVTYPICEAVIDDMVTVDEAAIADAMARIARSERWIVEGAAGVALAGFIAAADRYRGAKVAIVLCGRNIGVETFLSAMAGR